MLDSTKSVTGVYRYSDGGGGGGGGSGGHPKVSYSGYAASKIETGS